MYLWLPEGSPLLRHGDHRLDTGPEFGFEDSSSERAADFRARMDSPLPRSHCDDPLRWGNVFDQVILVVVIQHLSTFATFSNELLDQKQFWYRSLSLFESRMKRLLFYRNHLFR